MGFGHINSDVSIPYTFQHINYCVITAYTVIVKILFTQNISSFPNLYKKKKAVEPLGRSTAGTGLPE